MAPRNHKKWLESPNIEYISSECYNDHSIYLREQEEIFSKVWVPMCHISEMYNKDDFRTTQIAGQNVIAWNTGDGIKAAYNLQMQSPAGNQVSIDKGCGKKLNCEVTHGGMVWVTLRLLRN